MIFKYDRVGDETVDILITPTVIETWKNYQQNSRTDKEACGVLIGGYDSIKNQIVVEECTKPMRGDVRRRNSFILKDRGHQMAVDRAFKDSHARCFYLGTWHSHPTPNPYPSNRDLKDWSKCIARNPLLPCFLFSIVGTTSTFIRTDKQINNHE